MTGDIGFQTNHFADSQHFKIDSHFAAFGQVKIGATHSFLLTLDRSQVF